MLIEFWHEFLYKPLFNLLIWVYNNWTEQNLGWAVVYVTVLLRMALLPFTIITERNKIKNQQLYEEVKQIHKDYHSDAIMQKQEIRKVLKKRKVSPWSKVFSIGFQGLFVVLLYEVFKSGIFSENLYENLYPSIVYPGALITKFFGFELGQSYTVFWPGLVAGLLALEIYVEFRKRKSALTNKDLMFFLLFPGSVFVLLFWLPMVKSLFFLTSMLFTLFIGFTLKPFVKKRVAKKVENN